jgi:hypothetical protein
MIASSMAVVLGLPRYCWIVCHPICFEHVLLVWWTEDRETVDMRPRLHVDLMAIPHRHNNRTNMLLVTGTQKTPETSS